MPGHYHYPFSQWGSYVITSGEAVTLAKNACRGGARIIQYREKAASRRETLNTARALRKITADSGAMFIVNDWLDLALLVGADGVHLGQDDIPLQEARRITADGFVIGISTHSVEQAKNAAAAGADYIGIGSIFETPLKPDNQPIGIDCLCRVLDIIRIPVVAIGGINMNNIDQLKKIGITNVAMIRGFAEDTEQSVRRINRLLLGTQ